MIILMQIRVSKDDLEKERGAVMEEYRGNRNATGRMQDAYWVLMTEGSKVLQWKYFLSYDLHCFSCFIIQSPVICSVFESYKSVD